MRVHGFVRLGDEDDDAPEKGPFEAPDTALDRTEVGSEKSSVEVRLYEASAVTLSARDLDTSLRIDATPAEAAVAIDGTVMAHGAWEGRLPLGVHTVEITASGFLPARQQVRLLRRKEPQIRVALSRAPPAGAWSPKRSAAVGLAYAIGAAGVTVSAVTGAAALVTIGEVRSRCVYPLCPASQAAAADRAGALATASTVSLVVGAANLVAGTILVIWYRPDEPRTDKGGGPRPRIPPVAWSAGVGLGRVEPPGEVLRMERLARRTGVIRVLAAALALCVLLAACNALLGPHDFVYAACVTDADCAPDQTCSPAHTCELANGQVCEDGGGCASGFCSTDALCCAEACSGPCQTCPHGASCALVSEGEKGACTRNRVCTALGTCYCPRLAFSGPPAAPVYDTGASPYAVVALDLNSDGNPDLAVANFVDSTVSVLLNKGDGTFAAKVDYPTGTGAGAIAALDIDGDGKPDLVVANSVDDTVSVLFNDGDGTFPLGKRVDYPTGATPTGVAIADLNEDGKPDIAVSHMTAAKPGGPENDPGVSVLLNEGDGTFALPVNYPTGAYPSSIAALDLNGDGKPDLAVTTPDYDTVDVLLNNGDGTFAAPVAYPTSHSPWFVAIMDLNDDGKPDLAVTNLTYNSVSVLFNDGDGTFAHNADYTTDGTPYSVTAVDLNRDGRPDLAIANGSGNTVSVLLNKGDGTFAKQRDYPAGRDSYSVAAADLNGDGEPDLVVVNEVDSTLNVLINEDKGTFIGSGAPGDFPTGKGPSSVAAVDLNGDGKPDLAVANLRGNSVSVLLDEGDGTFATGVTYPTGTAPLFVAAVDLDGDGKPDLAIANNNDNTVSVLLNRGDGTFAPKVDYDVPGGLPYSIAAVDLNGDGMPDLAIANYGYGTVSFLFNQGHGKFQSFPEKDPKDKFTNPEAITVADLNGDGKPDLAVANDLSGTTDVGVVSVLLNKGDGTFAPKADYFTGGRSPSAIAALDLMGDGKLALAVANSGEGTVSVMLNAGDGTFSSKVVYPTGDAPSALVAVDLDGDGRPDLAVANGASDTLSVLLNGGDGTFTKTGDYWTGNAPSSVAAADMNGDGLLNLVVADNAADDVRVLSSSCLP